MGAFPSRYRHWLAMMGLGIAAAILPPLIETSRAAGASPEKACADSTPMTCGGAVEDALKALGDNPHRALELGLLWGRVFEKEVDRLKRAGRLKTAQRDADKIQGWFEDQIDPLSYAQDAALEALLKKYLPRMATVLGLLEAPLGGIAVFFDSSEIATDFDELRFLNAQIQERIAAKISPHLDKAWRGGLEEIGRRAGPALRAP